ncbi:uncharacterized protein LOC123877907 [Maniola jurtina]|uniref:uncharacterized protein LOC123877907 n=1 Tax=Maniola jurtina TaxID=191418 RepID=UPI001E68F09E|nr:uncharacterized protein LOC123877907 [Maniola jurtina]
MMNAYAAAAAGLALIVLVLLVLWKFRRSKPPEQPCLPSCTPVQLVHKLCPHNNVVQRFEVEKKDSLDEHLDALTRKLAEKEGRLHMSKYKIRETQDEIQSLHAIDHDVRAKYREIMDALRSDLMSNEKECKKLQEQIEWVSRRRAELRDEVRRGQQLYGDAALELATNLAELQRGRCAVNHKVTDKPQELSSHSLRLRKEPHLPRASHVDSLVMKSSPRLSNESMSFFRHTEDA